MCMRVGWLTVGLLFLFPARGETGVVLLVNANASFETFLFNPNATAQSFDGYSISLPSGSSTPLDPSGWVSIADSYAADDSGVDAQLVDAAGFLELSATSIRLDEGKLFGLATLGPGQRFGIGHPFGMNATDALAAIADTRFAYLNTAVSATPVSSAITTVPEPGAVAYVGLVFVVLGTNRYLRRSHLG